MTLIACITPVVDRAPMRVISNRVPAKFYIEDLLTGYYMMYESIIRSVCGLLVD
jgi:hypothetical protein